MLTNGLPVALVNPLGWSVGSEDDQGNLLVKCFCNGRGIIERCCARSAGNSNWLEGLLCYS